MNLPTKHSLKVIVSVLRGERDINQEFEYDERKYLPLTVGETSKPPYLVVQYYEK